MFCTCVTYLQVTNFFHLAHKIVRWCIVCICSLSKLLPSVCMFFVMRGAKSNRPFCCCLFCFSVAVCIIMFFVMRGANSNRPVSSVAVCVCSLLCVRQRATGQFCLLLYAWHTKMLTVLKRTKQMLIFCLFACSYEGCLPCECEN